MKVFQIINFFTSVSFFVRCVMIKVKTRKKSWKVGIIYNIGLKNKKTNKKKEKKKQIKNFENFLTREMPNIASSTSFSLKKKTNGQFSTLSSVNLVKIRRETKHFTPIFLDNRNLFEIFLNVVRITTERVLICYITKPRLMNNCGT